MQHTILALLLGQNKKTNFKKCSSTAISEWQYVLLSHSQQVPADDDRPAQPLCYAQSWMLIVINRW